MDVELPAYPALIKNIFKCGHPEMELAANLEEALHLRESAKHYFCTACYAAMIRKEEPCQQQPQAEQLISAVA